MIEIGKGYYIKVDPMCFILCQEVEDKGEKKIEEVTYHQDLHGVLRSFSKRYMRKKVPERFEELKAIEDEIIEVIRKKKNINVSTLTKEWNKMKEEQYERGMELAKSRKKGKKND